MDRTGVGDRQALGMRAERVNTAKVVAVAVTVAVMKETRPRIILSSLISLCSPYRSNVIEHTPVLIPRHARSHWGSGMVDVGS